MRGFALPIVALAVVLALLMCGTTAAENQTCYDYTIESNAVCVESPATQPAQAPVVLDPGSTSDPSATVACSRLNILPAARPRNILRQGSRLLFFLTPVC